MTLNIISDIHCDYEFAKKQITWNRHPHSDMTDEQYICRDKTLQISKMNLFLDKLNNCTTIDKFKPKYKNKWKYTQVPNLFTDKQQVIDCIEHLKAVLSGKRRFYKDASNDCRRILFYEELFYEFLNTFDSSLLRDTLRTFMRYEYDFVPEKLKKADYLIVAGDLGHDQSYPIIYNNLKERTKHLFKDVFFIKGNHDYWWFPKDDGSESWIENYPEGINFHHRYLEEQLDDNTVLLGCTMWAPISENDRWTVVNGMNDFRYIPGFTYNKVNEIYQEESNWLRCKVQQYNGKKIVIVTHHIPLKELISESYKHSNVNAAYAVLDGSCNDIKPNLWICGHSHEYSDKTIDGVRYIRNPIGYREFYGYLPSEVQPTHWYNTVVEI